MAWPVLPHGFLGTAAVTGDEDTYQVERSLRFNSVDNTYLSRTPSVAGNRKTWTLSFWYKKSLAGNSQIFHAGTSASDRVAFNINDANAIAITTSVAGVTTNWLLSNSVLRDTAAWSHFVVAFDTTQATASNRIRAYTNGVEITSWATDNRSSISQNSNHFVNATNIHYLLANHTPQVSGNGYLAEVHFIDGQALTPSSFGETDAITGRWKAKAYSGTYGTNGFYLPFSNNASTTQLGLDGKSDAITGSTGASPILNISGRSASSGVNSDSNSTSLVFAASLNSDANLTVDHSPSGRTSSTKTITNTSVTLESNVYKLYSGSALFNGTTARLSVPNSTDFQFGTGDFTIEGWVNPVALKANGIFAKCSVDASWATGWTCEIDNGYITFYDGSVRHSSATNLLAINNWYHVAWARQGSTLRMFVNGNLAHTATTSINLVPTSSFTVCNDSVTTTYAQNARVQDVRIYKGLAKYTAAFTPPLFNDWALTNFSVTAGVGNDSFVDSPTNYGALTHTFSDDTYQISRSLRFNSADNSHLTRTPLSAGNRKTWTWSGWVKRGLVGSADRSLFVGNPSGTTDTTITEIRLGTSANPDSLAVNGYSTNFRITNQAFRDPSVWYHFVVAFDTTQATADDRIKIYANGTRITSFATSSNPTLNTDYGINQTTLHRIGFGLVGYFDGYMAEVHFVDGQALTPDNFGVRDPNTYTWKPKAYTGTYGTNGFYLNFSDNSGTTSTTLGKDQAGSNNWTPSGTPGFSVASGTGNDSLVDTPTYYGTDAGAGGEARGDYATLDSSLSITSVTYSNGNLDVLGGANYRTPIGTIPILSGKWRWEVRVNAVGPDFYVGIGDISLGYINTYSWAVSGTWSYGQNGTKYVGPSSGVAYGASYTTGDVIGVEFDADAKALTFFKNGVSQGVAFNSGITNGPWFPLITVGAGSSASVNFGQRPFIHSGTFGFKALRDYNRQIVPTGGVIRGNYATMNELAPSKPTLLNGALQTNAGNLGGINTFGMTTGKWFCEMDIVTIGAESSLGVSKGGAMSTFVGASADSWGYYSTGPKYNNGSGVTYGASFTSGDTIGCAFDADLGLLSFYKNGVYQGIAYTGLTSGPYFFAMSGRTSTAANNVYINFGQRPWIFGAPAGFKPVCTTSIPQPTIQKPNSYFDTLLYTGNGSSRTLSGLGFSPNLVWIKGRSGATDHAIYDTSRGVQKDMTTLSTAAETTQSTGLTAFNPDGFNIGTLAKLNTNTSTYAAWSWDESAIAGFDIVTYTGNGTTQNVSHSLGVAPKMIIIKASSSTGGWVVGHTSMDTSNPWSYYMFLDTTAARSNVGAINTFGNNTSVVAPTSSVFTIGNGANLNANGVSFVAYLFAEIDGYNRIGSFPGNSSADGPFVWCGFRPAFILGKPNLAGTYWNLFDSKRNPHNLADFVLYTSLIDAEYSTLGKVDLLSNGFKPRTAGSDNWNYSGSDTYFIAFAESPFKYSRAR